MKAEMIRETIKKSNPRSAWDKGVKQYALDLLECLDDIDTTIRATIDAALLKGAESWQAYSYGGCADWDEMSENMLSGFVWSDEEAYTALAVLAEE